MKNENEMKMFTLSSAFMRFNLRLKKDKKFVEQLKGQFGVKKELTKEQTDKAFKSLASMIYSDSTANMKAALEDLNHSQTYYKNMFSKFSQVSFK